MRGWVRRLDLSLAPRSDEEPRAFVRSGPTEAMEAAAGAPRHLLHCASLELVHPETLEPLRLEAAVPPDFDEAWLPPG